MKKHLTSLFLFISLIFPFTFSGYASASISNIVPQCNGGLSNQTNSVCSDVSKGTTTNPVISIIKAVIEVISWVTGIAAVILITISGIRFTTSGGDAQKVAGARSALINAMIGIAITILAQTIVVFVLDKVN